MSSRKLASRSETLRRSRRHSYKQSQVSHLLQRTCQLQSSQRVWRSPSPLLTPQLSSSFSSSFSSPPSPHLLSPQRSQVLMKMWRSNSVSFSSSSASVLLEAWEVEASRLKEQQESLWCRWRSSSGQPSSWLSSLFSSSLTETMMRFAS